MSRRAQPWFAVAVLVAGVAASSVIVADADAPQLPGNRQTVELVAKRTVFTMPEVPAVGLSFVGGGDLFDAAGTILIGEGYSLCGIVKLGVEVPPTVIAHCTSTFRLPDGELHLSSLRTYSAGKAGFDEAAIAIVGGTEGYANARGDGMATKEFGVDVAYRFTLEVIAD